MKWTLPLVPSGLFGIVLGVAGLASAWRLASHLWGMPSWVGEALSLTGATVWAVLLVLYIMKWVVRRAEAKTEWGHPVLCCFVGIIPLTTALVGASTARYFGVFSQVLVVLGVVGTLAFGVYRTGVLLKGNRDPATTTPILYLPTVAGNFGSAIALSAVGHADWAVPFFGIGLLSWLALESVILNRLYIVSELAVPLRPSMGIQLAPPAVGCAAYLSITDGTPDLLVQIFIGYALFQALVMLRLLPWIRQQPFAASYWAFTFGVSALAVSLIRFVERGGQGPLSVLAPYFFGVANLVIGAIALGTVTLLLRGKLLPPPLVPQPG